MADINSDRIMEGKFQFKDAKDAWVDKTFKMPSVNHCLVALNFGTDGIEASAVNLIWLNSARLFL